MCFRSNLNSLKMPERKTKSKKKTIQLPHSFGKPTTVKSERGWKQLHWGSTEPFLGWPPSTTRVTTTR